MSRFERASPATREACTHIGIGAADKGWRIWLLVDDRDIDIVVLDGSPLWCLRLNPTQDRQPIP